MIPAILIEAHVQIYRFGALAIVAHDGGLTLHVIGRPTLRAMYDDRRYRRHQRARQRRKLR